MKIIKGKEEEYQKYHDVNQDDDYSKACITAGEVFMKALDEGKSCDAAEEEMCKAEAGLTGFMVSMIMKAAAHFHERGEEVRLWWNEKNGVKSDHRIVNTAILNIGDDGKMSPDFENV